MTGHREWSEPAYPPFAADPDDACSTADAAKFFPNEGKWAARNALPAKRICRRCPLAAECLAWAIETRQDWGIWGGTTPAERRRLLERTPA